MLAMNDVKVRKIKKILRHTLPFSRKPNIWSFYVVVLQRTTKKCTKMEKRTCKARGLVAFSLPLPPLFLKLPNMVYGV